MSPDNMPDFDKMTPEEITAWMETLAKRQGATEGLTTAADVEIAEIDPSTVVIDEPGYIPYSEKKPQPAAAAPPPAPRPAAPPPAPVYQAPPRPAAYQPPPSMPEPVMEDFQPTVPTPAISGMTGSLAWLENLAADQNDDLFNLDLSDDGEADVAPVNTVSWLEDLARSQGELTMAAAAPPPVTSVPGPADDLDLNWLETLAKRQGADPDELITPANASVINAALNAEPEPLSYTPFSFETPTPRSAPVSSPTSWLESIAAEQGYDEIGVRNTRPEPTPPSVDLSAEGIERAIADGSVTPEQMQMWLNRQADTAMEQPELPIIDDASVNSFSGLSAFEEEPAVPGEIPSWLLDQLGGPPAMPAAPPPPGRPSLESLFPPLEAVPAALPIPDWLLDDESSESPSVDDIFAPEPVAASASVIERTPIEVDPTDPWVEALDQEYEQGAVNIEQVPDWYTRNISDPERLSRFETAQDVPLLDLTPEPAVVTGPLMAARLPQEMMLPEGETQAMPDWMQAGLPLSAPVAVVPPVPVAAPMPDADAIPDWLLDVESQISPADIPDWLKVTIQEPEPVFVPPKPEPVPVPVAAVPPPVPRPVAPPPAPRPVVAVEGLSVANARARRQNGDLPGSLDEYDRLIRASVQLDDVVDDLSTLVKLERRNPVVYRVLGDGLMRQGKLQAALDTYREALNQL